MRFLYLIQIVLVASLSAQLQAQSQPDSNSPNGLHTFTKPLELQKIDELQEGEELIQNEGYSYICGRCGSENHLNWKPNFKQGGMGFIPHCQFCGKKYWPKFKPSNAIKRTFCQKQQSPPNCRS